MSENKKNWMLGIGAIVLLLLIGCAPQESEGVRKIREAQEAYEKAQQAAKDKLITQAECNQIESGQSLSAVQGIVGDPGKELSRVEVPGTPVTFSQQWTNKDGGNAIVLFQDGKVISKTCYGL